MFDRIIWQYWENSYDFPDGIAYIDLCHQSVDKYSTVGIGYKVIRLNEKNLSDYIDVNPYLYNLKDNSNQLAQKSDYIRAKLKRSKSLLSKFLKLSGVL